MNWNNLSMKDRASYIRMGVESGITDLGTIREAYNKFAEGGNLNVNDNPEKELMTMIREFIMLKDKMLQIT